MVYIYKHPTTLRPNLALKSDPACIAFRALSQVPASSASLIAPVQAWPLNFIR
jgi:hypothetical protein